MKVTVTGRGGLDPSARFFRTGDDTEKLVFCSSSVLADLRKTLDGAATVLDGGCSVSMRGVAEGLYERGVRRLMVEGGSRVHTQFLTAGLADELQLVMAPLFVGDSRRAEVRRRGTLPVG